MTYATLWPTAPLYRATRLYILTALYTLTALSAFSAAAFGQTAPPDTTPQKWEVSVDLKPLFRQDQPYSLFVKRRLTERKALRVGISAFDWTNAKDSSKLSLDNYTTLFYPNEPTKIIEEGRIQLLYVPETHLTWSFSLGYQYTLKTGKVGIYIASDLSYQRQHSDYFANGSQFVDTFSLPNYDGRSLMKSTLSTYSLLQSLGINYHINANLSFSIESSLAILYSTFTLIEDRNLEPVTHVDPITLIAKYNSSTVRTILDNRSYSIRFQPFMGLFLNYHF